MRLGRILFVGTVLASALLLPEDAGAATWIVPGHFTTIQAAMNSYIVKDGDTIEVLPTVHLGATVTKAVRIHGVGIVVINDGPLVTGSVKAGFLFPGSGVGSGATITNLQFHTVGLPVFSRGADDVSVTGNTMWTPLQGVSNWAYGSWGKGWVVTHNRIWDLQTSCGSGIGILIGDFMGGTVTDNLVAHNEIRGRVRVPTGDCGGYNAPGVLLFADFRFPGDLGAVIERTRVLKNWVQISSSNSALVTVSGIELSDTRDDPALLVIQSNEVVYNDLYRMTVPVSFHPDNLPTVNRVERNYVRVPGPFLNGLFSLAAPASGGPSPIR